MWQFARIIVTVTCLALCMLIVVIWMRASRWRDTVYYVPQDGSGISRIDTYLNRIYLGSSYIEPGFAEPAFSLGSYPRAEEIPEKFPDGYLGFVPNFRFGSKGATIPYWMLLASGGSVAALVNAPCLRRFSLRTALVAMVLVALTFGLGSIARSLDDLSWRWW